MISAFHGVICMILTGWMKATVKSWLKQEYSSLGLKKFLICAHCLTGMDLPPVHRILPVSIGSPPNLHSLGLTLVLIVYLLDSFHCCGQPVPRQLVSDWHSFIADSHELFVDILPDGKAPVQRYFSWGMTQHSYCTSAVSDHFSMLCCHQPFTFLDKQN